MESSCIPSAPTHAQPPPLSTPHTRMFHLLQSMNLQGHITITQSLWFTLGFTLRGVHSMDLDKCIMTCSHHSNIMQSSLTALKSLCALLIHSSLTPSLWEPLIFLPSP